MRLTMTKEDILQALKAQKAYIQKKYAVDKIGLFRSYAKDTQTEQSDIDIYVEFKDKTFLSFPSSCLGMFY